MKQVFIIRPFGTKNGIDFDRIETELIRPAMDAAGCTGGTTGEIVSQGNIRTDMFHKLLVADLVIADISIYNPNAYYELGVRHAFREKRSFLIRCSKTGLPAGAATDDVPFDLKTDRYLEYRLDDLAGSREKLTEALKATLISEKPDSPIFQLLPNLTESDPEVFLPVPREFGEAVDRAAAEKVAGDLSLLAEEAETFEWAITGLRAIGRALFKLEHLERGRVVWERVRARKPDDLEANLDLGTIYQRLGDLTGSEQALDRVLSVKNIPSKQLAEAQALRGRNAKDRWKKALEAVSPAADLQTEALRSKHLRDSWENYAQGYEEHLNHYYSGLNALAMLTVQLELAAVRPEIWAELWDDDETAALEFAKLKQKRQKLAGAVESALDAAQRQVKRTGEKDDWLNASLADFRCLTMSKPERVAASYRDALANLGGFNLRSVHKQLLLYRQLGVLKLNVDGALALNGWEVPREEEKPTHVFLFTGHVIDAPGRETPRFPAAKEDVARARIKDALQSRLGQIDGYSPLGISGGASGGDILFHEVCAELGIPTDLYLALPENRFVEKSVEPAGPAWVDRFYALAKKLPKRVLATTEELPIWLRGKKDYNIWQRNNLWMLHNAIAIAGEHLTLIALWDGKAEGDGRGGTADMIRRADEAGARTIIIDTRDAFGVA